jgi:Protein of unknown function (DUF3102)
MTHALAAIPCSTGQPVSALELVIDLPFLAGEINEAHRQVTSHAKGMLLEAKRAGDALLAAKGKVKHGEFTNWIEANCRCSVTSAREYMQVAKHAKGTDLRCFGGGVRAFLEAHAKPRITPPSPTPSLTPEAAERILNIQARVERGEGAERAVAATKLAALADEQKMPLETLLERSRALCPDREKSADQLETEKAVAETDAAIAATEQRIEALEEQLKAFQAREALITKLMDLDKDELAEQLADALIELGRG